VFLLLLCAFIEVLIELQTFQELTLLQLHLPTNRRHPHLLSTSSSTALSTHSRKENRKKVFLEDELEEKILANLY
jgi:hypothetical protein